MCEGEVILFIKMILFITVCNFPCYILLDFSFTVSLQNKQYQGTCLTDEKLRFVTYLRSQKVRA
jgi:hypothetical protein